MQRLLIFICGLFFTLTGFSQQDRADSLEHEIRRVPRDTSRVRLLNEMVNALRDRDSNRALPYAQEALELASLLHDQNGLGGALENLAWIHYRRGDYSQAFSLSADAIKAYQVVNNEAGVARCYIHIAAFQYEQKLFYAAIDNFRKSYDLSHHIADTATMVRSLSNISLSYINLKAMDSAKFYSREALRLSERAAYTYGTAAALRTLCDIDIEERRHHEALQKIERVLSIATALKNTFLQASSLHRIGKIHLAQGKPEQALPYLIKALDMSRVYDHKDEMERIHLLLADAYRDMQDHKKAFEQQRAYLKLHDSLNDRRNGERIALMQARFDSELKEAEIELLTKDMQLKQEEINSQRVWMYFYIGSLTLLVLLAFVLLYNYQVKRRANRGLQEKNKEIQRQAQELSNINGTKDKLFSIISHDLRSPLSSLRGLMDLVIEGVLSKDEFLPVAHNLKYSLESVQENLDNLLYWAQSQLKGLQISPEAVSVKQLVMEMSKLFQEVARSKDIAIVQEVGEEIFVYADKNHLRLVLRNLMANAIKFSRHGGRIIIRQQEAGEWVEVSVTDSGVGMSEQDIAKLFNAETHFSNPGTHMEKGIGIGLLLTKEFIEKNNGQIQVKSELGKGSTFTFALKRDHTMANKEGVLHPFL
jgi:signal transduction histidine kinase